MWTECGKASGVCRMPRWAPNFFFFLKAYDKVFRKRCNDASNIQGRGADKDGWSDDEREVGTTCAFRESWPRFVSTNERQCLSQPTPFKILRI